MLCLGVKHYLHSKLAKLANSILFRLQSGHCQLNNHLHKIGAKDSPNCIHCQVPETVAHFLISCPQYDIQRSALVDSVRRSNNSFTRKLLLTEPDLFSHVVTFVLACGKKIWSTTPQVSIFHLCSVVLYHHVDPFI